VPSWSLRSHPAASPLPPSRSQVSLAFAACGAITTTMIGVQIQICALVNDLGPGKAHAPRATPKRRGCRPRRQQMVHARCRRHGDHQTLDKTAMTGTQIFVGCFNYVSSCLFETRHPRTSLFSAATTPVGYFKPQPRAAEKNGGFGGASFYKIEVGMEDNSTLPPNRRADFPHPASGRWSLVGGYA
jgi:hypothetical protein